MSTTPRPFLARDVAQLLGVSVAELSSALVRAGLPPRSQGMAIDPEEALVAACALKQPDRTALQQYDRENAPGYRDGYNDGRLIGFDVGMRMGSERVGCITLERHTFTALDIVKRVVTCVEAQYNRPTARWALVSHATAHGSTVSRAMCVAAGFDPDEVVKRRR